MTKRGNDVKDLIELSGEVVAVGDMQLDEAAGLARMPRVMLRTYDDRIVTVSGLTQDECRACAEAFLLATQIVVRGAV